MREHLWMAGVLVALVAVEGVLIYCAVRWLAWYLDQPRRRLRR